MQYITFGETRVPKLGLGTWQLDETQARRVVSDAIELGYRHIDTAAMYGNEAEVGQAVMASGVDREEIFLTTKVWRDDLAFDDLLAAADQSLERLGTGYVDLLLVHWPNEAVDLQETMTALRAVRQEGRARHIGVSNFPREMLERADELAPILCEQVEFHVYLQQHGLHSEVMRDNLMLTAYCPLARGKVNDDETLREIGKRHGKTPAQVALRWLVETPYVAAIPKASSREHLAENIDIFDFELDRDDLDRIAALDRGERLIDPAFAPDWSA